MGKYTVFQTKTHLSRLLRKAAMGEEVTIVNRDKPVAKIVPISPKKRIMGSLRGKITVAQDFDAPLEDFKEYMK